MGRPYTARPSARGAALEECLLLVGRRSVRRAVGIVAAGNAVADVATAVGATRAMGERLNGPRITREGSLGLFVHTGAEEAVETLVELIVREKLELESPGEFALAFAVPHFHREGLGQMLTFMAMVMVADVQDGKDVQARLLAMLAKQFTQGELLAAIGHHRRLEDLFTVNPDDGKGRLFRVDDQVRLFGIADADEGIRAFDELFSGFLIAAAGDEYICHRLF